MTRFLAPGIIWKEVIVKATITLIALAAIAGFGAPAVAGQVAASEGVTLTEAAQAKFNADTRGDDRHVKPTPGTAEPTTQLYRAAGLSVDEGRAMSLDQVFVAKINREARSDERQLADSGRVVVMGSRAYGQGGDHRQLAASAGLDPSSASEMSLAEIAAAKFAAEGNDD